MAKPLYDFDMAVARMRAARAAIDKTGGDVLLTGRSEGFIRNRADMAETIRRLKAYADAGADCLYAPGIKTREEIAAVVKGVAPKPVNFLMGSRERADSARPRPSSACGASASAVRWRARPGAGFMRMAKEIAGPGSFKGFADAAPGADIVKGLRG